MTILLCLSFLFLDFVVGSRAGYRRALEDVSEVMNRTPKNPNSILREINTMADVIAKNCDRNTYDKILNDLENRDG